MKLVDNNTANRATMNLIPCILNPFKAYVLEMHLTGTEKQVEYAKNLATAALSKAQSTASTLRNNGTRTREQLEEGIVTIINYIESLTDAGKAIDELKKHI